MKDKIAKCVREIGPAVIRQMSMRAAAYENVISLGIGEPDFDTPEDICEAAMKDAKAGHTHYTPSKGYPELIRELAGAIETRHGIKLDDSQLMITHGGMGGIGAFLRTVLDTGDQALVPEPHFPTYRAQIGFTGAEMIHVPTRFEDDFVIQPDAVRKAVTPQTKVMILNSPNNPTGSVISGDVMDELAKIARDRDLLVLSDEVYDRMVYTGPHESIYTRPDMAERTVVVNSFSKAYAMTGWRMGYAYGPEWLIEEMLKVATFHTSCPSSVGQRAALNTLRADGSRFDDLARRFEKRCEMAYERLRKMPGIEVAPTAGSFYIFPKISAVNPDCMQFAIDLLDQEQVIVIPGSAFGPSGRGFVRIACTVDMDRLSEAMDRVERYVRKDERPTFNFQLSTSNL